MFADVKALNEPGPDRSATAADPSGIPVSAIMKPDTTVLAQRARDLLASGRPAAARPIIAALRRFELEPVELAHLEATLHLREGHVAEALAVLDRAIAKTEDAARLRICRAELRLESGDLLLAADDAAAAVIAEPWQAYAKALLGIALMRLGRADEAVACLAEACASEPGRAGFRLALAQAQESAGNREAAAANLLDAIAVWPGNQALRSAAIMAAMRRRDFADAVAIARSACEAGLGDAAIFGLLGHALSSLGQHQDAVAPYAEALKLAPHDPYVQHLVAAAGLRPGADRAPAEYVECVFDGYADRFEAHLIELGYRVPGLIRTAIERHRGLGLRRVLDLGCGTGLMGLMLADFDLEWLSGVDLSSQMIEHALAKKIYHELAHADVVEWLAASDQRWDLIVASDVLSYLGNLGDVARLVADRLAPGGLFIFSVEESELANPAAEAAPAWHLTRQGRFTHSADYIRAVAVASSLRVVDVVRETLRNEGGAPLAGLIVVLQRAAP